MNWKSFRNLGMNCGTLVSSVALIGGCTSAGQKENGNRKVASEGVTTVNFQPLSPAQLQVLSNDAVAGWTAGKNKGKYEPSPEALKYLSLADETIFGRNGYAVNSNISDGATGQVVKQDPNHKYLRMTQWNIERGQEYQTIEDMLTFDSTNCDANPSVKNIKLGWSPKAVDLASDDAEDEGESKSARAGREACSLRSSDVIALNEVDMNVCRSDNRFVAQDLAKASHMNFAFAPEFIELEPNKNGSADKDGSDPFCDKYASTATARGKDKIHNLTGNAILSKFPISNVRVIPLSKGYIQKSTGMELSEQENDAGKKVFVTEDNVEVKMGDRVKCYDWHEDEIKNPTVVDRVRNKAGSLIFREENLRELRYGRRNALVADLTTPSGIITVVNTHLENKTDPSCRIAQMREILRGIGAMKSSKEAAGTQAAAVHPIVLAGDLNTTGADLKSHSLVQTAFGLTVMNPQFDASQIIGGFVASNPYSSVANLGKAAFGHIRLLQDPTRKNLAFELFGLDFDLSGNAEGRMFDMLKKVKFNFADGTQSGFFSGDNDSKYYLYPQYKKTWSATNARKRKGFEATEYFQRTFSILGMLEGGYKIDWIFVANQGEFLRPAFPETLNRLRTEMGNNFPSDHVPTTVMLNLPN